MQRFHVGDELVLTKVLLLLHLCPLSSQKGQHALWKYIGGGNSHAPLRFDIDRILDSGCGLGEWTMVSALSPSSLSAVKTSTGK